jgi:hypothetical protein
MIPWRHMLGGHLAMVGFGISGNNTRAIGHGRSIFETLEAPPI